VLLIFTLPVLKYRPAMRFIPAYAAFAAIRIEPLRWRWNRPRSAFEAVDGFLSLVLPSMFKVVKTGAQEFLLGERMRRLIFGALCLAFGLALPWASSTARAQPPYSAADFSGTWGFGVSGTVIFTPPPTGPTPNCAGWISVSLPIAIDGTLIGDGKGGLSGTQTFNANGLVCIGTLKGTYTVNADGTGTLNNVAFTPNSGSPPQCTATVGSSSFTFSNIVNHIDLAGTDCFQVTSGSATKQ
jgi:hypothetical protein